ncbi:CDF-like metal transporter [Exidia glandulosa HHB12029]|uniref:CDF-like metal transporter n=1 Tax=Exidia glandulosa HHB12029 TaxID=1314781 RepID=A0A165JHN9_EXIGL|nr:CDF-like metal transporter [Exidia glandulosa HHB12029]
MVSATSTLTSLPSDLESIGSCAKAPEIDNNDPLGLRTKVVSDEQLVTLRSKGRAGRRLASFYRGQNKRIRQITQPVDKQATEAQEREDASRLPVRIAVWASLVANMSLCILQLYAALSSRSISLIATAVDSVFDIGSNVILLWVHRRAQNLNTRRWPAGGARLETVGNAVYGSLMSAVNLIVVVESVHLLVEKYAEGKLMKLHIPSLVAVAAALGAKMLLFLYCLPLRRASSQIAMLWEDHRNDIFINGFGLLMSAGGSKLIWFLDPLGGAIIGCGVIVTWTCTIYGLYRTLAGAAPSPAEVDTIIYHATTSSTLIRKFRSFKVYHNGEDYTVEIHATVSPETSVAEAHMSASELRHRLEKLPRVDSVLIVLEPDVPSPCAQLPHSHSLVMPSDCKEKFDVS